MLWSHPCFTTNLPCWAMYLWLAATTAWLPEASRFPAGG
jgi:hypothetical protein